MLLSSQEARAGSASPPEAPCVKGAHVLPADIERAALDRAVADLRASGTTVRGVLCDVGLCEVGAMGRESDWP